MTLKRLGALRYAGDDFTPDFAALPTGAAFQGATFDATDVGEKYVHNGTNWIKFEFVSPLTTKGDLYGFDSADARLPVGTDGQVLESDSVQPLGVKWASPSAPADPTFHSMTLENTTPDSVGNPPTGEGVFFVETVDGDNDGVFCKIKIDGSFKKVRVV